MGLFSSPMSFLPSWRSPSQPDLSEDERKMYRSEREENFRWIARLLGKQSSYTFTDSDLIDDKTRDEIEELGQFAEVSYSSVAVDTLVNNSQALFQSKFPFEHLNAFSDCQFIATCLGTVADVQAYLFLRSSGDSASQQSQLVVSMPGTCTPKQALYDVLATKTQYPSGSGYVHFGFWELYKGIKDNLIPKIRQAIADHSPDQLVLTGHSMGGSLAYLLLMDLLSEDMHLEESQLAKLKILIVAFGAPRAGDANLVGYFHDLVNKFKTERNLEESFFTVYSVQGYNDGVPTLPPKFLGYVHFCKRPLYTIGGKLYLTPSTMEDDHETFQAEGSSNDKMMFPKGGHNYYNRRDLELFRRRTGWLVDAKFPDNGWEERYRQLVARSKA